MPPQQKHQRGFTLIELLLALTIISILSTAVATLLTGAAKTSQFVNTQADAASQLQIACRRILHNVRATSFIMAPLDTNPASTFTLSTQPDPSNADATYTVSYTLSGTDLTESDPRYNAAGNIPNVLVSNVTTFSVTRLSLDTPQTVLITITVGTTPPITRTLTIYCRNL